MARFIGGHEWEVYDIEVETTLMRIIVCGLLEAKEFIEVTALIDGNGIEHDAQDFWND